MGAETAAGRGQPDSPEAPQTGSPCLPAGSLSRSWDGSPAGAGSSGHPSPSAPAFAAQRVWPASVWMWRAPGLACCLNSHRWQGGAGAGSPLRLRTPGLDPHRSTTLSAVRVALRSPHGGRGGGGRGPWPSRPPQLLLASPPQGPGQKGGTGRACSFTHQGGSHRQRN